MGITTTFTNKTGLTLVNKLFVNGGEERSENFKFHEKWDNLEFFTISHDKIVRFGAPSMELRCFEIIGRTLVPIGKIDLNALTNFNARELELHYTDNRFSYSEPPQRNKLRRMEWISASFSKSKSYYHNFKAKLSTWFKPQASGNLQV